ncbi:MAG: 6-phosphogluconolactonase [Actinobacteria bacterium]|nr:6-phosphogluconolactonase [Actinomycetota bacterium]
MEKKILDSPEALIAQATIDFAELLDELRKSKSELTVLLTGGTLGIDFIAALGETSVNLTNIHFIFGDERYVPRDHADRNEHQALAVFPGLQSNLIRYPEASEKLKDAKQRFSLELENFLGPIESPSRQIDLTILGMGPDGHIASLFPGVAHEGEWIVSEDNSPSERLSFSYQALNNSERVWFLVAGAGKADALRSVYAGQLPASKVQGLSETRWYLDKEISDAL